ncbi:Uncharacterized protein TCM_035859 [Theobroma cacao]|uniref:Uncharacterized protein n=1 Tax=Theobroma cacao TaxID=3641 RepID=A0A061FIJ4_THECC|nr:Uncharacterized protein TCM_035859 [Theobroma cacao]
MTLRHEKEIDEAIRGESKRKDIALKVVKHNDEKSLESDNEKEYDEEIALLTKKFNRSLKSKQGSIKPFRRKE